jgi:hypothetical protein
VKDWWEQETLVSPNMKDTHHRLREKNVISHPIHLLLETQVHYLIPFESDLQSLENVEVGLSGVSSVNDDLCLL